MDLTRSGCILVGIFSAMLQQPRLCADQTSDALLGLQRYMQRVEGNALRRYVLPETECSKYKLGFHGLGEL